jgi:hypothetical protein
MATVQQFINDVLTDIGEFAPGETPNSDESDFAFRVLNQIISSWSLEELTVYVVKHETFNITATVDRYTMGPSGVWATAARPVRVTGASTKSGNFKSGLDILSWRDFEQIDDPIGTTSALPTKMGVDNAAPLLNVGIWPMPNLGSVVEVSSWQPLTQFAALGDTVAWPYPGYDLALRDELTFRLCTPFGRPMPEGLMAAMQLSKQRLMQLNSAINGQTATAVLATPAVPSSPQAGGGQ